MINELNLIVTQGPYSSFLQEISLMPQVKGIRLNSVMPIKEDKLIDKLKELFTVVLPKDLWIDLKARQLRVMEFANTPYTSVKISHKIKVKLPNIVYFDNGTITGKLVDIDGDRLILEDYVGRLLGPGESVNIIDETLEYVDTHILTDRDIAYIDASKKVGIKNFMLSYVEKSSDIKLIKALHPESIVMSKIESSKGLKNLKDILTESDYIMAARGDLYTEIDYPHLLPDTLKDIIKISKDKAVVGSRILNSLLKSPVPSSSDIMDISYLKDMGYKTFMIGDDICFKKEILLKAINIFKAIFS